VGICIITLCSGIRSHEFIVHPIPFGYTPKTKIDTGERDHALKGKKDLQSGKLFMTKPRLQEGAV
jgi:hypothetical protein